VTQTEAVPYGRRTQREPAVSEVNIIWCTAGLGCDGDTISITAATQPSIEDVLLGAIPGLPTVHLFNPVLAYENGAEYMESWYKAERGELEPFVLVVEGSIPNEKIKKEGYWAAIGTDPATGQPITTCEWIDRLAPKATAVIAIGTCATYGGIHAMQGNPTGAMGLADYLGWDWRRSSTCSTWWPAWRRSSLSTTSSDPPGCSDPPSTRAATAAATTSRVTSQPTSTPRSAW